MGCTQGIHSVRYIKRIDLELRFKGRVCLHKDGRSDCWQKAQDHDQALDTDVHARIILRLPLQQFYLCGAQFTPGSNFQPFQVNLSYRCTNESQREQAHRRGHMTDLAFLAFAYFDLKPTSWAMRRDRLGSGWQIRGGHNADFGGKGREIFELYSPRELNQFVFRQLTLHQYPIRFLDILLRIRQFFDQRSVICQQQQAFTVSVQASGRVDVRYIDELLEGRMPRAFIGEL